MNSVLFGNCDVHSVPVHNSNQTITYIPHWITIFGGPVGIKGTWWIFARNLQYIYFQCLVFQGILVRKRAIYETTIICTFPPAKAMAFSTRWSISPGSRYKGGSENLSYPVSFCMTLSWKQAIIFSIRLCPRAQSIFLLKLWQKQKNQPRQRRTNAVGKETLMMGMGKQILRKRCRSMVLRESGTKVLIWKKDFWVVGIHYILRPQWSRRTTTFVSWTRICLFLAFLACVYSRNVQFKPLTTCDKRWQPCWLLANEQGMML